MQFKRSTKSNMVTLPFKSVVQVPKLHKETLSQQIKNNNNIKIVQVFTVLEGKIPQLSDFT